MAGQTLQEILAGLGVQQGTVAQVKKGRSEGKIIDKIIAKIKADLKAIDDNGEKFQSKCKAKPAKITRSNLCGERRIEVCVK